MPKTPGQRIVIEAAENGYIVRDHGEKFIEPGAPRVFADFKSMVTHLKEELERNMEAESFGK